MPKTLFVVDDSVTMRKVFELTFAGEELTVVTHDGSEGVTARAREVRPSVAIVDVALGGQSSGYDVVRALRADNESGSYPVFVLHSDHSPLDEAAARAAGASGALVKPFETQVMIDRIRQVLAGGSAATTTMSMTPPTSPSRTSVVSAAPSVARPAVAAASTGATAPQGIKSTMIGNAIPGTSAAAVRPAVAPPAPKSPVTTTTVIAAQTATPAPSPAAVSAPATTVNMSAAAAAARAAAQAQTASLPTITIEDSEEEIHLEQGMLADLGSASDVPPLVGPISRPASTPPAAAPAPARQETPRASRPAPVAAPAPVVSDGAAAEIARKVASLGLTAAQVEAVTALTREVVERVVWEVVPVLAETLIREEILRLTAEPSTKN